MTEVVSIPVAEIAKEDPSMFSLMPSGLLESLKSSEATDLIAYLMTK
jgi:hypothetical protein